MKSQFPKRALAATLEWLELHREELNQNWQMARDAEPLQPIPTGMNEMLHVTSVESLNGFRVRIEFNDGDFVW